jgi:LmbE family N-acetylglucosaminyl deacetylase
MNNSPTSRRTFFKNVASASIAIAPLSVLASTPIKDLAALKILCIGGHPDDPESGCGGTLAKLSAAGHDVTSVYLTRGEAGIPGKSHDESAAIRSKEAEAACKLLNIKPHFLGQVDGNTIINNEWIDKMAAFIEQAKPDIVFTHWPIDSHKDHQAASILTTQAWMRSGKKFDLYYFEVLSGIQTVAFHPTDYVDITLTRETKRKAVYSHTSQHPETIYSHGHELMEQFRGLEAGYSAAEAFVFVGGKRRIANMER